MGTSARPNSANPEQCPRRGFSIRSYNSDSTADTGQPPALAPARASELDQSRDAARIGRALAASPLAAKMIEVFKTPAFIADGRAPNSRPWPPITVDEHVARSRTRSRGHYYRSRSHHYGSGDANADSERNPRRSERRATRQKQARQNFRFHFLVLLTHCMKARELPSLSGSISVGDE